MKNLQILTICLFISVSVFSQSQKIAHVNFDSLVSATPEAKIVKEAAEKFMLELKTEMQNMETEFKTKYENFMATGDKLSELSRRTKEEELRGMQSRLQEFGQQAEIEYQKKLEEMTSPVVEKVKKAVGEAAKENGYNYVFDLTGNIIYADHASDLFSASKKKMDAMPPAKIPGTEPANPAKNKPAPKATPR